MSGGFTADNLVSALPSVIREDEKLNALAVTVAEAFENQRALDALLSIYYRLDELDESMLNILARCFKIDWWDDGYTLEEKRGLLRNVFKVKRTLGTVAAIKYALEPLFDSVEITEWFEYGGEPYHYKISIGTGEGLPDYEKIETALSRLEYFANLRSVLDEFDSDVEKDLPTIYVGAAMRISTEAELDDNTAALLTDENGVFLTDKDGAYLTE